MGYETEFAGAGSAKINSKNIKKYMPFIAGGLVLGLFGFMLKNKNDNHSQNEVGFSEEEDKISNNVAGVFNQQQQEYTQMLNQFRQEQTQQTMELSREVANQMGELQRELINSHTSLGKSIQEQEQNFNNKILETTKNMEQNYQQIGNQIQNLKPNSDDNTIVVKKGGNEVETRKRKVKDYKEIQNKMHSSTYKNYEHDFLDAKRRGDEHAVKKIQKQATEYVTNT